MRCLGKDKKETNMEKMIYMGFFFISESLVLTLRFLLNFSSISLFFFDFNRTEETKYPATNTIVSAEVYQWLDHPFIRGAYSCSSIAGTRKSRENLIEPIDNKIFFAGEAAVTGPSACIHHAMNSGASAAEKVLSEINYTTPQSRL